MALALGIDLGTARSCIAAVRDGEPFVMSMSSVVSVHHDGSLLVGDDRAFRARFMTPERTVAALTDLRAGPVALGGRELDRAQLVALLLERMRGEAEARLDDTVAAAAIAVPAAVDDAARAVVAAAARAAGMNDVTLVDEPVAVAQASDLRADPGGALVVFDMGSATTDVAVIDGAMATVASVSRRLGGDAWDRAIVDWLVGDLRVRRLRDVIAEGVDISQDRLAQRRLYQAAERAKVELSTSTSAAIDLRFITANMEGPKHIAVELTGAAFDELTARLRGEIAEPIESALAAAGVSAGGVARVVVTGGMAAVPAVRDEVRRVTNTEVVQLPYGAAAIGAARRAAGM